MVKLEKALRRDIRRINKMIGSADRITMVNLAEQSVDSLLQKGHGWEQYDAIGDLQKKKRTAPKRAKIN